MVSAGRADPRIRRGSWAGLGSLRWRRWAWLGVLTATVTAAMTAFAVPSPALFAGLLVAVVLALLGRAPTAVPRGAGVVSLGVLAVCAVVGVGLARIVRVPAGALLGPMVLALALDLSGWSFGATPPCPVVEIVMLLVTPALAHRARPRG